jgi:hypothetical protein
MNLVQFIDQKGKRRVGLVVGASIIVLKKAATTLDLARLALARKARSSPPWHRASPEPAPRTMRQR